MGYGSSNKYASNGAGYFGQRPQSSIQRKSEKSDLMSGDSSVLNGGISIDEAMDPYGKKNFLKSKMNHDDVNSDEGFLSSTGDLLIEEPVMLYHPMEHEEATET
jgi:hypothetical protein